MKHFLTVLLVLFSTASVSGAERETDGGWGSISTLLSLAGAVAQSVSETSSALADDIRNADPVDPLEKYNRMMFSFNSELDRLALRPMAENYETYTPAIVRTGVRNFFSNISDVGVVANSALQGKFDQAVLDATRLTVNTIAGIGGVIDVASMIDLEKNNEDFGQTFGVWGVPEGPYIVLPLLGPRTARSALGTAFDTYLQVETLGAMSEATTGQDLVSELFAMNLINQRSQLLGKDALLEEAALDPYVFAREAYLQYRRCQVEDCDKIDYRPAPPESQMSDDLFDEIDELDQLDELYELDEVDQMDAIE